MASFDRTSELETKLGEVQGRPTRECLAFSHDATVLAACDDRHNLLHVWRIGVGARYERLVGQIYGFSAPWELVERNRALAFAPDGLLVATSSSRAVRVFDITTADEVDHLYTTGNKGGVVSWLVFFVVPASLAVALLVYSFGVTLRLDSCPPTYLDSSSLPLVSVCLLSHFCNSFLVLLGVFSVGVWLRFCHQRPRRVESSLIELVFFFVALSVGRFFFPTWIWWFDFIAATRKLVHLLLVVPGFVLLLGTSFSFAVLSFVDDSIDSELVLFSAGFNFGIGWYFVGSFDPTIALLSLSAFIGASKISWRSAVVIWWAIWVYTKIFLWVVLDANAPLLADDASWVAFRDFWEPFGIEIHSVHLKPAVSERIFDLPSDGDRGCFPSRDRFLSRDKFAISPSGRYVAVLCKDSTIGLWEGPTRIATFGQHCNQMHWATNDVIAVDCDYVIRLVDVADPPREFTDLLPTDWRRYTVKGHFPCDDLLSWNVRGDVLAILHRHTGLQVLGLRSLT